MKGLGDSMEALLARFPRWFIPPLLIEAVARSFGGVLKLVVSDAGSGTEARLRGILSAARYRARGMRIGRRVQIEPSRNVVFGDAVTLYGDIFLGAPGERGRIEIGERSHMDRQCVIHGNGGVRIGHGCAVAAGVIVYSQTNQYQAAPSTAILEQGTRYAAVEIGDDVWIGAGAVVFPGVNIGDHAVVGAGAVVHRDVAPWQVVGGVPARVLKDRRADDQ